MNYAQVERERHKMYGIVGIHSLNGEPVSSVVLPRMTDAVAHRGLDGEDSSTDGNVGVGHRRLAIIDFSLAAPADAHA